MPKTFEHIFNAIGPDGISRIEGMYNERTSARRFVEENLPVLQEEYGGLWVGISERNVIASGETEEELAKSINGTCRNYYSVQIPALVIAPKERRLPYRAGAVRLFR